MARRLKKEDLASILVELPWWASAGLGIAGYIGLRWIIPSTMPPLAKAVGASIQAMAWLPLATFGFFSLLSFARSKTKEKIPVTVARTVNGARSRKLEPVAIQPVNKLDHEWGSGRAKTNDAAAVATPYCLWTLGHLE